MELGKTGDMLLCISTSGNSANCVAAAVSGWRAYARLRGILLTAEGTVYPYNLRKNFIKFRQIFSDCIFAVIFLLFIRKYHVILSGKNVEWWNKQYFNVIFTKIVTIFVLSLAICERMW